MKERLTEEPDDGIRKYGVVFGEGTGVAWDLVERRNKKRDTELMGVEE